MTKSVVNIMTEFTTTAGAKKNGQTFSGYIDYENKKAARKEENKVKYDDYINYMGNTDKTTGVFSSGREGFLTEEEIKLMKQKFDQAMENNNILWKTVISFDMEWLKKNNMLDADNHLVEDKEIIQYTRSVMNKILEKEGIKESAAWCGAIHYDQDNIHIHIATTEPGQSQRPRREDGELKGKWKYSSIKAGKSIMANSIMNNSEINLKINQLMRDNIIGVKKESSLFYDRTYMQIFYDIYTDLPDNKRYWTYRSNILGDGMREKIDSLTKYFIDNYCKEDMEELKQLLKEQQEIYREAYGSGDKVQNHYAQNKIDDLYYRMGNTLLKEMKEFDARQVNKKMAVQRLYATAQYDGQDISFGSALSGLKRSLQKDMQQIKNEIEYEQLQEKIEHSKKGLELYP